MIEESRQVLVTGAAGGIGEATVRILVKSGYTVIGTDLKLPEAQSAVEGVTYISADLQKSEDIQHLMQSVPDGRLYGVVNTAGVAFFRQDGSIFDITNDVWTTTLGVNLEGTRNVITACLPLLRRGQGKAIVNIASIAGSHGMDSPLDAYQVSKAAIVSLSKSIAIQLGPEGIRCNTICPGAILTPMIEYLYSESPERQLNMEERTPLRRLGLPADIAHAVDFLLSERASYITGTDLIVDGGWTAQVK